MYHLSEGVPTLFIKSGCTLLDCVLGGGWPLGRLSNVVGDRSTGKCAKNLYVVSRKDGLLKLDDLADYFPEGATPWEVDLLLEDGRMVRTSHYYKEKVASTIRIETQHGLVIEGTPDHKIRIWTPDCAYEMRSLKDLSVGDIPVISTKKGIFPEKYQPLHSLIEHIQHIPKNKHGHPFDCQFPTILDEDFGWLLGVMVADGNYMGKNSFCISSSKQYIKKEVDRILSRYVKPHIFDFKINICSVLFTNFLRLFFGESFTARYKKVPELILKSPESVQSFFLRGLIDCDSYCNKKSAIEYYTASSILVEQVKMMLMNFGIVPVHIKTEGAKIGRKHYNHVYHRLYIRGRFFEQYGSCIGSLKYPFQFKNDSNFDGVPYFYDKAFNDRAKIRISLGHSPNGKLANGQRIPKTPFLIKNNTLKNWRLPYSRILQLSKIYRSLEKNEKAQEYENIYNRHDFFSPITKKSVIDEPSYVFDVCIPDGHLFWGNGFTNHNTLIATEACANFMMQFPKGKIRYIDSEAAFDVQYAEKLGIDMGGIDLVGDMETVEDLHKSLSEFLDSVEDKGLFILDSLDALTDQGENESEISKGTFGAKKPKIMSQIFRRLVRKISEKNVHVMLISQTRDLIGRPYAMKTKSGGNAIDFFVSHIVWLHKRESIKKTIQGKDYIVGIGVEARCEKNKIARPFARCEFPLLFGYGMDDAFASIAWLEEVGAIDRMGEGSTVRKLENAIRKGDPELEERLRNIVIKTWAEIDSKVYPKEGKYAKTSLRVDNNSK